MRKDAVCSLLLAAAAALPWFGASTPADAAPAKQGAAIELYANLNAGDSSAFQVLDASGRLSGTPFELPSGRVLVVTDVFVTPNAVEGVYEGNVDNVGGGENRIRFRFNSAAQAMLHLPLSSGIVFATTPQAFAFATDPGGCVVRLLGTLKRGS